MERRDIHEYKHCVFWKEADDDILFIDYAPRLEMDLAIAKEIVQNRLEYSRGASVYGLIDFTNMKSVTKEARDYMNEQQGGLRGISGGAFLSNSRLSTAIINFYLTVNKPSVPAKFFTQKEDALNWLRGIKKAGGR